MRKVKTSKEDILQKGYELNEEYNLYKICKDEKKRKKLWSSFTESNQKYRELFESYLTRSNDISGLL